MCQCNKVRMYNARPGTCGRCIIDLRDINDLKSLDIKSIVTIMFIVATDSNVSSYSIKINDNKVLCNGNMTIESIRKREDAQVVNIKYCINIMDIWLVHSRKEISSNDNDLANRCIETLENIYDIHEARKVMLHILGRF